MCQGAIPSCWNSGEADHIADEFSFEVEDLSCQKKQQAICTKGDRILTYGTLLDVLWLMYHTWITYGTVRRIA